MLPISLIKGRKGIEAEQEDVDNRLAANKERQRVIRARYFNKNMPKADTELLESLEDEERQVVQVPVIKLSVADRFK